MIRCLAIDDETPALDILEDNIRQVPFLQLVGKCKNAYAAMDVLQNEQVDLLFLDIEMPGITGLGFLRSLTSRPMVILITAYRHYAADGFDLDVLDYLTKPVAFDRFLKAVNKAREYQGYKNKEAVLPAGDPQYLFISTEYQLTKVFVHEMLYIEGSGNYIRIFLAGNPKPLLSKLSLKLIEEKLPVGKYARVHKSFIVMIDKIHSIRNDCIRIGQTEINISRSYKESFYQLINDSNIRQE